MSQKPSPLRPVPTRSPDYIINEIKQIEAKLEELRQWIRSGHQDDEHLNKTLGFAVGLTAIQDDLRQIRSWCEASGPTSWWRQQAMKRLPRDPSEV